MISPTIPAIVEPVRPSPRRWTRLGGGVIVVLAVAYLVLWHTTGYSFLALVASLVGGAVTLTIGLGAVLAGYFLGWLAGNRGFGMYLCAAITAVVLSLFLVPGVALLVWLCFFPPTT